jgi:hypothetical protein
MENFKKVCLTLLVLGIGVWFLKEPNKQINKIIDPRSSILPSILKFDSDREGVMSLNGEQMHYEKSIVNKLPIDLLREFKLDADHFSNEKAKIQKHDDKYFAWYIDKSKKSRGLIVYPYKTGASIVFKLSPSSNEEVSTKIGIPLPEEMKQIMVLNASKKQNNSISIYKSPLSIEMIKNWFAEKLVKNGWKNAKVIIQRENIENFDTFTHEKKKCFIQYEEKNTTTIITIVIDS